MKFLAINASYRGDKGHTRFLIDKLFAGAAAAGAECQVVTLACLRINRCLACGQCQTAEHSLECIHDGKDDVAAVFRQMAEADIVVYATPVYVFGMSGLLKTFLERFYSRGNSGDLSISKSGLMFHQVDHAICSKPFVALVCCDSLENETPQNALAYFRTFSRFLDAPQVGALVRNGDACRGTAMTRSAKRKFPKYSTSTQPTNKQAASWRQRDVSGVRLNGEQTRRLSPCPCSAS
ncbi:MAG: flavodoxin family protein [Anaerolineaceae bacterium]|nr:flavodoxin family protein [Anaerolineaceae bacterium]